MYKLKKISVCYSSAFVNLKRRHHVRKWVWHALFTCWI